METKNAMEMMLTLRDLAAWQFPELVLPEKWPENKPLVGIPSLQRGAVWKPQQVELIWDSIFRGFPIGSLVIAEKIQAGQKTRSGKYGRDWEESKITHHLLDGQQRCNAIALGFLDPFESTIEGEIVAALWLDLAPKLLPSGSTRSFLFRLTTQAHLWGFQKSDETPRLTAEKVRGANEKFCGSNGNEKPRLITETWPIEAEAAIPLAWLMTGKKPETVEQLKQQISEKCKTHQEKLWVAKTKIKEALEKADLNKILRGVQRAFDAKLIALEVPKEAISAPSYQEANEENKGDKTDISNVEHLFDRINSKGTRLEGEELMYSMIKAYWPGIEESFDSLRTKLKKQNRTGLPMPESKLALLATRAALLEAENQLPPKLSVSALRVLAHDPKKDEQQKKLKKYLGIGYEACDLHEVVKTVDSWLLYEKGSNQDGLPPVLRTELTHKAPDAYLLLMWLAKKVQGKEVSPDFKKGILALATTLLWFSLDHAKAAQKLYERLKNKIDQGNPIDVSLFQGILTELCSRDEQSPVMIRVVSPDSLKGYLTEHDTKDGYALSKWNWWERLVVQNDESKIAFRKEALWPFIERIRKNRSLLIYAQRELMHDKFSDYDPSRPDLWEEHNRPWDFDHLLAQYHVSGNRGQFREVCYQWLDCIANLHVVPFSENRSWQKDGANSKLNTPELRSAALFDSEEQVGDYSISWDDLYGEEEKISKFVSAARTRFLRIYQSWFDKLEVRALSVTREDEHKFVRRE